MLRRGCFLIALLTAISIVGTQPLSHAAEPIVRDDIVFHGDFSAATSCTPGNGYCAYTAWDYTSIPLDYQINASNDDGLSQAIVETNAKAGMHAWESDTQSAMDWIYLGLTSDSPGAGSNIIWFNPNPGNCGDLGPMEWAACAPVGPGTGFDIELNDASVAWTASLIKGIVMHEAGHILGLGHVTDCAQVMANYDASGNLCPNQTSLGQGDLNGVKALYPAGWTSFVGLDPQPAGGFASGPDAASWGEGRIDVFARSTTNTLLRRFHVPLDGWSASWEDRGKPLGLNLTGDPTAVSWGANRIDVFSLASDGQLWHIVWNANQWSAWEPLSAPSVGLVGSPDVASWGSNRLDVFARGGDNKLWHRVWNGQWNAWENLCDSPHPSCSITSDPSAVSWASNRIDVLARGTAPDNHLYRKVFSAGWNQWENLCASPHPNCAITSGPDVASWAANRLDIFAAGAGNKMFHRVWTGTAWGPWEDMGGFLTADPGVVSWAGRRVDVFVRGANNFLYYRRYAY
jgi:hypothetical protein